MRATFLEYEAIGVKSHFSACHFLF